MTITKNDIPGKWTPEHQERNNRLHPLSSFSPPNKEGRRHRSPQEQEFENKKFHKMCGFPLRNPTYL